MTLKKIQFIFIVISLLALVILIRNWYSTYNFNKNPIPQKYQEAIAKEEQRVLVNMQKNFGFQYKVPIIITDKIPGKIYGVTSLGQDGSVKIYLNKKVMKESIEYIISNVIAHEYAHAVLFKIHAYNNKNDGHSKLWQNTCVKLGGAKCEQYVNSHDVIMKKLPF
ncbi:SprT-like domain-containing protein [Sulfurospirillum arcachonense]|uniref:SprT-like domain-containing protein n=1 Tax=Sulfurospirillum arcachonense TaxID=57666 RepID=UPI000469DB0B|nr:SprT-like domain-containing protein [Sulfurospirillum arcachonense]